MPEPRNRGGEQDWAAHLERERARYEDGESRLPGTGGRRRAAAPADPARQRGRRRRARAADAGPHRRGRRVVPSRRRPLPRELRRRAAGQLGPADRGDQVPASSPGDWAGAEETARWALDAGARDQRRARSAAMPPRSRCSSSATTSTRACARRRDPQPRRLPGRRRRRAGLPRGAGRRRLHRGRRGGARVVRGARGLPRGHAVADTVLVLQALARPPRDRGRAQLAALCLSPELDRRRRVEHRRDHDRRS